MERIVLDHVSKEFPARRSAPARGHRPGHGPGAAGLPDGRAAVQLVAPEGTSVFTAAVDARTAAVPGWRVRLSVNPARFHFFDRETGRVIRARPLEAAEVPSSA